MYKPKPMVEIGGMPIIWHIMKIYSFYGINDFIICLGYKGYVIKEYFKNYFIHSSNVTFDLEKNKVEVHEKSSEPWRVTLVDTGHDTQIGGRIKKIIPYLGGDDTFCLTYGDGVGDVNITELIRYHRSHKRLATVTAVQPPGRFGSLRLAGSNVSGFQEKPDGDGAWISGGFFVLSKKVEKYIKDEQTVWEREPMEQLAQEGELYAWRHTGFWKPMDTLRDKVELEKMWADGRAPWKLW